MECLERTHFHLPAGERCREAGRVPGCFSVAWNSRDLVERFMLFIASYRRGTWY